MHDAAPSTPIFRRLRLENWRNFTQVDVDLQSCQVIVELSARRNPNIVIIRAGECCTSYRVTGDPPSPKSVRTACAVAANVYGS